MTISRRSSRISSRHGTSSSCDLLRLADLYNKMKIRGMSFGHAPFVLCGCLYDRGKARVRSFRAHKHVISRRSREISEFSLMHNVGVCQRSLTALLRADGARVALRISIEASRGRDDARVGLDRHPTPYPLPWRGLARDGPVLSPCGGDEGASGAQSPTLAHPLRSGT